MTLASLPKPSTAGLGEVDDSEEEDDDQGDGRIGDAGGGRGSRSGEAGERHGGLPGSRRKTRMLAACPFDREEILQIWLRYAYAPVMSRFHEQRNACQRP